MKPEITLKEGRNYINWKTASTYRLKCFAKASWDTEQTLVVYLEDDRDVPRVCSLEEFKEKIDEEWKGDFEEPPRWEIESGKPKCPGCKVFYDCGLRENYFFNKHRHCPSCGARLFGPKD